MFQIPGIIRKVIVFTSMLYTCSPHRVQSSALGLGSGLTSVCCTDHLTQDTVLLFFFLSFIVELFVMFCFLNWWIQALKLSWPRHAPLFASRRNYQCPGFFITWFYLTAKLPFYYACRLQGFGQAALEGVAVWALVSPPSHYMGFLFVTLEMSVL